MAAGRCQFDGCNTLLIEHHVTKEAGNYADRAHIVAYKPAGPRGGSERPTNIHSLENLMLVCSQCHKLIDDNPTAYSTETLREYKRAHEERVRLITGLDKNHQTKVLLVKARISDDLVDIVKGDVTTAIAPYYPDDSRFFEIDLTQLRVSDETFYDAAQQTIRTRVQQLLEIGPAHISVFALAPIPVLIFLGNVLTNKITVDLFQRHRDNGGWKWKNGGTPAEYAYHRLRDGVERSRVALILSLSGEIDRAALPSSIDCSFSIYEIRLENQEATPDFLKTKIDLDAFRLAYRSAIADLRRNHGILETIALFPAVPAPVAIACGHDLLPKVDPALDVYDYDKRNGGFRFALTVNRDRRI